MAKQEAVATDAPPTDAPPSDEPKPGEQPVGAPAEEPKAEEPGAEEPKGEGETPADADTPSAFEKMTEGLTDPDEIEAVRARLLEKLPEDRREPKPELGEADTQSTLLAEQRRQEGKRENEAKREGALTRLNTHLKQVRQRLAADDPSDSKVATLPDDYDPDLLSGAINEIVQSEIALADQGARELFSTALAQRLQRHGGPIADDEFKQIVKDVAENKVEHGIVGAYLDKWGERRYQEGLTEGQTAAKSKDEGWRKAESAAVRAELMSERGLEPDAGPGKPPIGSLASVKNPQEYMALSEEDRDRLLVGSGGNSR
jgi:hypothetical protein